MLFLYYGVPYAVEFAAAIVFPEVSIENLSTPEYLK
jgi:hypothetical protein